MSTRSNTFATHYRTLETCVETLRTMEVRDLDRLVGLVEKASAAHRACKQRIDAIRSLTDNALSDADATSGSD